MKTSKTIKSFLKKNWITFWLVFAALIFGIISVSAAYTSMKYAKRVVSTGSNDDMLFSSNYLIYPSVVKTIQNNNAYIYICNYAKGNTRRRYSDDLPYKLSAVLTNQSGTALKEADFIAMGISADEINAKINGYTFKIDELSNADSFDTSVQCFSKQENGEYAIESIENIFIGGEACMDRYTLTFPQEDDTIYPIYVKVIATPNFATMPNDLHPIEAIFGKKSAIESEATIKWSGEFVDALTASNTKNFDAFNYRITGNGSGTFTLMWDTKYVELGKWSKEKLPLGATSSIDATTGMTILTFPVGEDNISQYDLQFYRTNDATVSERYDNYTSTFEEEENNQYTVYAVDGAENKPYVLSYFKATEEE